MPGDVGKSLLIVAIRYAARELAMPPRNAGGKLSDQVIRDFETWIAAGAVDPREGSAPKDHEVRHLEGKVLVGVSTVTRVLHPTASECVLAQS